jgi:GNAT superfamily N-acetyltransferase
VNIIPKDFPIPHILGLAGADSCSQGVRLLPEPVSFPQWRKGIYTVRTDPGALDLEVVCEFLSMAPWNSGLGREALKRALGNSLCFSLFERGRQIGLARVITDFTTYAYLCDVYVIESHRHRGLGRWLIRCVLEHPSLASLKRISLITHDAQEFYLDSGFRFPPANHYMERLARP